MSFAVAPDAYDRFMGRYSVPLAPEFADFAGVERGQTVLDVGCGPGALTSELVARVGVAAVAAVDPSEQFVEAARERHPGVRVERSPAEQLPFADDEFDVVVASLVLHYLEDWAGPLAELRRVLKPGGRLIVSVIHPSVYAIVYPEADYFALTQYSEDYVFAGQTVVLTYWHRPLHAVTDAFIGAGFRIAAVSEPPPAPDTPREVLPPDLEEGRSFICFLFFVLEAD